jgi:hypothetical protein
MRIGDVEGETVDRDVLTAVSAERLAVGNTWHFSIQDACVVNSRKPLMKFAIWLLSLDSNQEPSG